MNPKGAHTPPVPSKDDPYDPQCPYNPKIQWRPGTIEKSSKIGKS